MSQQKTNSIYPWATTSTKWVGIPLSKTSKLRYGFLSRAPRPATKYFSDLPSGKQTTYVTTSGANSLFLLDLAQESLRLHYCYFYLFTPTCLPVSQLFFSRAHFFDPDRYNWNYLDQLIGGIFTEFTGGLKYWRMQFSIIPQIAKQEVDLNSSPETAALLADDLTSSNTSLNSSSATVTNDILLYERRILHVLWLNLNSVDYASPLMTRRLSSSHSVLNIPPVSLHPRNPEDGPTTPGPTPDGEAEAHPSAAKVPLTREFSAPIFPSGRGGAPQKGGSVLSPSMRQSEAGIFTLSISFYNFDYANKMKSKTYQKRIE